MNKDIVKGNWNEIKGKLKQQWGKFTDNDITTMQGSYDELSGKLQKLYGYQKEEAKEQIDNFLDRNGYNEKTSTDY